jgi:hypothetical protein
MNNNNCEPNVLKEKNDKLNKFVTGKFLTNYFNPKKIIMQGGRC